MAAKLTPVPTPHLSDGLTVLSLDQVDEIHRFQHIVLLRRGLIDAVLQSAAESEPGTGVLDGSFVGEITTFEAVEDLLNDIEQAVAGIDKVLKAAARRRLEAAAPKGDA